MSIDLSQASAQDLDALAAALAQRLGGGAAEKPRRPRRRRAAAAEVKYLTEDELARLFAAISSVRDRAIFRLAYHRGLRAGEIGRLQLADYRPAEERIEINRLKGSRSGEFHLTAHESRALRAWLRVRGTVPGPLFRTRLGSGISQQMLDKLIKRYGTAAGLPRVKCHMHALKHSCGTHLMSRGEHIEDVQDHLGHVNIQNTLIYARITNKRREERDRRLREW